MALRHHQIDHSSTLPLQRISTTNFDLDDMRSDVDGNLYATLNGDGKIIKLSPEGKVLQTILATGYTFANSK
ncbi:hypothetical protein I7I53_04804 [Histoplasma capsulatum var. duboisii H88]|uniref:SMP-30/Gluconolactonase/LRE-like region domain-containing protein n=1 Tax=Ajellomyces capsulatus (strain H88) TaxID=544711 RepID=A0A8A1LR87_AJEC8|nr:hypothetical protein I7I53_04804 [Histoplasma capsulatum var. duboisii H88]